MTTVKNATVNLVMWLWQYWHIPFVTSTCKLFTIPFQFTQAKLTSAVYFYISISNTTIIIIIQYIHEQAVIGMTAPNSYPLQYFLWEYHFPFITYWFYDNFYRNKTKQQQMCILVFLSNNALIFMCQRQYSSCCGLHCVWHLLKMKQKINIIYMQLQTLGKS